MRIAIASDHRGFDAKRRILFTLREWGHEVTDLGCDNASASDYPDFAIPAAGAVAEGRFDVAILIDGNGIGMSVAANKVAGARAAVCHDEVAARLSREHNHCNVICLGADLITEHHMRNIIQAFLATAFGQGRHLRRVRKLCDYERRLYVPRTEHSPAVPVPAQDQHPPLYTSGS